MATPEGGARRRQDAGFGLIELIVVIGLVAVLTAVAVPSFIGLQNAMRDEATQADLRSDRTALVEFSVDNNGKFPDTGFNPRAASTDLLGYGWSQSDETVSFRYTANTGRTAWCLDMTSSSGNVWRISTNTDQAQAPCSGLPATGY